MTSILGQSLPPPRAGNVWAMLLYPGGRRVVVQAQPYRVSSESAALQKLAAGHRVYVSLDDAIAVLRQAHLPTLSER